MEYGQFLLSLDINKINNHKHISTTPNYLLFPISFLTNVKLVN